MPRRTPPTPPVPDDAAVATMAALLPLHAAPTPGRLADAAAAGAERLLGAAHTFLYLEGDDGLIWQRPESALGRRLAGRAVEALGAVVLPASFETHEAPAIAACIDAGETVVGPVAELFAGAVDVTRAAEASQALGIADAAAAPLEPAGAGVGALIMLFTGTPDLERVRAFTAHVAHAAGNLRLAGSPSVAAPDDVAHAVFDARKLESELERELARASRYHREVSLVVVEATNLRLLRERFGPALTERLLDRLAAVLAHNARDVDVIGGYRERGFAMVLTEAPPEGAALAADRLLAIARTARLEPDVPGLELHLAAGWATAPPDGGSSEALFAAAERRMYGEQSRVA